MLHVICWSDASRGTQYLHVASAATWQINSTQQRLPRAHDAAILMQLCGPAASLRVAWPAHWCKRSSSSRYGSVTCSMKGCSTPAPARAEGTESSAGMPASPDPPAVAAAATEAAAPHLNNQPRLLFMLAVSRCQLCGSVPRPSPQQWLPLMAPRYCVLVVALPDDRRCDCFLYHLPTQNNMSHNDTKEILVVFFPTV
jgi:hypothetical protein